MATKEAAVKEVAEQEQSITAYKAFGPDWKCRNFQYEVGKTYTHEGDVKMCNSGFHACAVPFDCWAYYKGSATFARVSLSGASPARREDSKIVAAKITIEASMNLPEWIKAQVETVLALCKSAKGTLVGKEKESAAATGYSGHAAATGYSGHAAATGNSGHAAATGYSGHAAATGDSGHAAATGNCGVAFAGFNGKAKASASGSFAIAWYSKKDKRAYLAVGVPGKGGIEADTWYR